MVIREEGRLEWRLSITMLIRKQRKEAQNIGDTDTPEDKWWNSRKAWRELIDSRGEGKALSRKRGTFLGQEGKKRSWTRHGMISKGKGENIKKVTDVSIFLPNEKDDTSLKSVQVTVSEDYCYYSTGVREDWLGPEPWAWQSLEVIIVFGVGVAC